MNGATSEEAALFAALVFAAEKHRQQKRKDQATPYVNHVIKVAELLARFGVSDLATLQAAVLHDTVEDTDVTASDLEQRFGKEVASVVLELTDDKALPKARRKRLQVENAPSLTPKARLVKLADKLSNISELTEETPPEWDRERKVEYLDWAEQVVDLIRGTHSELEAQFDQVLAEKRQLLV